MSLPAALRSSVDRGLEEHGHGPIVDARPTAGGCISETWRLETARGGSVFLKWSKRDAPVGLFDAEATSLRRLAATRTLRVPDVIAAADGAEHVDGYRWLLIEWLEPGSANRATWDRLARGLAALHFAPVCEAPGAETDNYIGTLPQSNAASESWPAFWRDRRLRPQLERALSSEAFSRAEAARFDSLLAGIESVVPDDARLSLLHGDLWSGNLHVLESGEPALIDPSSYCGHREVDIAMTQLFGGFDPRFLAAYHEVAPLDPGFHEVRCPVYQLYYLLVHLNLFGGSYRGSCLQALGSAGF